MSEENSENWQLQYPDLRSRAAYLFRTKLYSDCEFKVGPKTISAHKLIMAMASPVFAKMLYTEVRAKAPITISQVRYEVFMKILKYIYTDVLNIHSNHEALDLYEAAKMWKLTFVSMTCVKHLGQHMEAGSVCNIYKVALETGDPALQKACMKTFCTKTKEILNHKNFLEVDVDTVEHLFSLEPLNIDHEMDLFNALIKYVKSRQKKSTTSNDQFSDDSDASSESDIFDDKKNYERQDRRHASASRMSFEDSEQDSSDEDGVPNYHVILKQIRFLTFTPREFANYLTSLSVLLSPKEIFQLSMKISSYDSPLSMPEGFSSNMVPRTLAGLEERSKPEMSYRSVIHRINNLNEYGYESETFVYRNMAWIFRIIPHKESLILIVECLHSASVESLKKTIMVVLKFYSVNVGRPDKEFILQVSKVTSSNSDIFFWASRIEKSYLLNLGNGLIDAAGAITYKVHIIDKVRVPPNVAYSVTSSPSDTSLRISTVKQSESSTTESTSHRRLSYRDFKSSQERKSLELEVTSNMAKLNRSFEDYSRKRSLKRARTKSTNTVASTNAPMCTDFSVSILYKPVQSNPSNTNLSVIQSIKKPRLSIKEIPSSVIESTEQNISSNFSNANALTTDPTLPMSDTKLPSTDSNSSVSSNLLTEISKENTASFQQKVTLNDLVRTSSAGTVIDTTSISVSQTASASVSDAPFVDSLPIQKKKYFPPRTKSLYSCQPLHARTVPWPTKYVHSKTNSIASSQSRVSKSAFIQKKICSSTKSRRYSMVQPPKSSHPKKVRISDIDQENTQTKRRGSNNLEYLVTETKINTTDHKTDVNDSYGYSKEVVADVPDIEMQALNASCDTMQVQPKMLKDITTTMLNSLISSSKNDNNCCMNVKCLEIMDSRVMIKSNKTDKLCDLDQLNNNQPKTLKGVSVNMINHIISKISFNRLYKNLENMERPNDMEDVTIGLSESASPIQTINNTKTHPKSLKSATISLLNTTISNKNTFQHHDADTYLNDGHECYEKLRNVECPNVYTSETHIDENNTKTHPRSLNEVTMALINTMISHKENYEYHNDEDLKDGLEHFNNNNLEYSQYVEGVGTQIHDSVTLFQTQIIENNNKPHPKSLKDATRVLLNSMISNKDIHEYRIDRNVVDCIECFNNNLENVESSNDIEDVIIGLSETVSSFQRKVIESNVKTQPKSLQDVTMAVLNTMISNKDTCEYNFDKDFKGGLECFSKNLKNIECLNDIEDVRMRINESVTLFKKHVDDNNAKRETKSLKDVTMAFLNNMISENNTKSQPKSLQDATIALIKTMISSNETSKYHPDKNSHSDDNNWRNKDLTVRSSVTASIYLQPKTLKEISFETVVNDILQINKYSTDYYLDDLNDIFDRITYLGENNVFQPASLKQVTWATLALMLGLGPLSKDCDIASLS